MIPLAKDTQQAIGAFAEKVENRTLLFEKMALAKSWGHESRFDDANRFNILRASSNGTEILSDDRDVSYAKARKNGKNAAQESYKAKVAGALAGQALLNDHTLLQTRLRQTNRFIDDLQQSYKGRIETFVGTLESRLLVNMAGGIMENAGIALDRCFGLPYIPGSAIKGVARNHALWQIQQEEDMSKKAELSQLALLAFGYTKTELLKKDFCWAGGSQLVEQLLQKLPSQEDFQGLCSFLPAYPQSGSFGIVAECMTPHPEAAQAAMGKGSPRPLFYPAVERDSSFVFCVIGHRIAECQQITEELNQRVLAQASTWLQVAIQENGIGAKTGAGYGWFRIDHAAEAKRAETAQKQRMEEQAAAAEAKAKVEAQAAEETRRSNLSEDERICEDLSKLSQPEFADYAKNLHEKNAVEQKAFCSLLAGSEADQWKRWKKAKKWKSRVEAIRSLAAQHSINLN